MQLRSSRRNFIKGITAAGIVGGFGIKTFNAFSAVSMVQPHSRVQRHA
ncbi:twin-arginine translocation signal domain-containing protein [Enterobacter pasteurii]